MQVQEAYRVQAIWTALGLLVSFRVKISLKYHFNDTAFIL